MVVLDEAYSEFAGVTLLGLRAAYPRLVVIRTASKAYALAGLRVGFAIAARDTLAVMEPYRPPGSVSTVSVTIVTEALADPDVLSANLGRVETERAYLADGLRAAGWNPEPSITNFLLVPFRDAERAATVAQQFLKEGLVPRTFPADHPLANCLRLTVRDRAQDDRLLFKVVEGLYADWSNADRPAELHIFTGVGHGFGLRTTNQMPAGAWPERFREWLADRGFLRPTH